MNYTILSPDGITINLEGFKTLELALEGFKSWAKGFIQQGYYSSNRGRIDLRDLEENCILTEN